MLIPNPQAVFNRKNLLPLMVLHVLMEYTDENHHLKKEEISDKIDEIFGFEPARNTLYEKINALIQAGFPIVQGRSEGVYYDANHMNDGVLRYLVDSVLYSDFVTHQGAAEIIKALESLGSRDLQKYISSQGTRIHQTRKSKQQSVFLIIEDLQSAINQKHQISCNYLTWHADLTTEHVYQEDITVNPYDLIFKNGKYYLLGALNGSDKMLSWRVDRLDCVKILDSHRYDIPQLKEISAGGGMAAYADLQPNLCGGIVETFRIKCARTAIDEIVDVFGRDFQIAPEQNENYDDETVILSVRATRESMKAWAVMHAGSMVVTAPDDFRREILDSLHDAEKLYRESRSDSRFGFLHAKSLHEAIRYCEVKARKMLVYRARTSRDNPERVDLSEMARLPDLTAISLSNCMLEHADQLEQMPVLRRLKLYRCQFSDDFRPFLPELQDFQTDDPQLAFDFCKTNKVESLTMFCSQIRDAAFICVLPLLKTVRFSLCKKLTDLSALQDADQIENLFLLECSSLTDYSFLDGMKNLKRLYIRGFNSNFDKVDIDRLKQRGIEVDYQQYDRDETRAAQQDNSAGTPHP